MIMFWMTRWTRTICLIATIAVATCAALRSRAADKAAAPAASQSPIPTTRVSSAALGLSFDCPEHFVVGHYEPVRTGDDPFFADGVVLIDRSVLQRQRHDVDLRSVPPGDFPSISFHPVKDLTKIVQPTTRKVINGNTICQLPFFPGPYGDSAFVYILPRGGSDAIAILAHKADWTVPGSPPTGYDRVVEKLLTSVHLENAPATRPARGK